MNIRREDGVAMIVAMMAMLLMTALGVALVLTTSSETMIAGNFRNSGEALYAADAVIERAMDDILTVADWNKLLDGSTQSAFVDGPPSGERTLPDGSKIDLMQAANMANCQHVGSCSPSEFNTMSAERPWAENNPHWQLYAYGNLKDMLPATDTINSAYYVMVMVADDPSDNDNDPMHDGVVPCPSGNNGSDGSCNPGTGVIALRAEAFGPRGTHKVIEITVARTDTTELERGYTGQRGQDEQNRRARKAAVQTPGKALTMQTMTLTTGGIH
jgi:type IV pilus assembly PilX-like protein